ILAFILALVLPSSFKGEAVVMLDPRKTNVSNIESVVSSLPSENSAIRSQIDTIKSRAVIDRVIDQLKLMENPVFNPSLRGTRWFLRLFASRKAADTERRNAQDRSIVATSLISHL